MNGGQTTDQDASRQPPLAPPSLVARANERHRPSAGLHRRPADPNAGRRMWHPPLLLAPTRDARAPPQPPPHKSRALALLLSRSLSSLHSRPTTMSFQLPPGMRPAQPPAGGNGPSGGGGGGAGGGGNDEERAAAAAQQEEMKRTMIQAMLEPAARERREWRALCELPGSFHSSVSFRDSWQTRDLVAAEGPGMAGARPTGQVAVPAPTWAQPHAAPAPPRRAPLLPAHPLPHPH